MMEHIHKFREDGKLTECGKATSGKSGDKWSLVTCQNCLRSARRPGQQAPKTKISKSSILQVLALGLLLTTGCADMGHQDDDQVRVRPCEACYYHNDSGSYQSLYLPDGRVLPVPAGSTIDLDELGIRNYTVHEARR